MFAFNYLRMFYMKIRLCFFPPQTTIFEINWCGQMHFFEKKHFILLYRRTFSKFCLFFFNLSYTWLQGIRNLISDVSDTLLQPFAVFRKKWGKKWRKRQRYNRIKRFSKEMKKTYNFIQKILLICNLIYLCYFCPIRTPYFNFWMLIFFMLIWQLKALPDIFFWDTDFKIVIFAAKNTII